MRFEKEFVLIISLFSWQKPEPVRFAVMMLEHQFKLCTITHHKLLPSHFSDL